VFADEKGFQLTKGDIFRFDSEIETPGTASRVHLPHPEIIIASEVGHKLLVDDGKLALTVVEKGIDYLDCIVENDGIIKVSDSDERRQRLFKARALSRHYCGAEERHEERKRGANDESEERTTKAKSEAASNEQRFALLDK